MLNSLLEALLKFKTPLVLWVTRVVCEITEQLFLLYCRTRIKYKYDGFKILHNNKKRGNF